MTRIFVIGTRGSPLALAQAKFVEDFCVSMQTPHLIHMIKTTGDKIQDRPLCDIGGKALFSKEIERALLDKEVDIGVHSLKDLETPRPNGLILAAYLPRADVRDVLVTRFDMNTSKVYGCQIANLPPHARVGTSAPRRAAQLKHHRPDVDILPLRGNVGTRLGKLNGEGYDAMVFAKAGLDRLGIEMDEDAILGIDAMIPAVGQGIIALECRDDDTETIELLQSMNDKMAEKAALFERGYIERLHGASCRSSVGIHAAFLDNSIHIHAMIEKDGLHRFTRTYASEISLDSIWHDLLTHLPKTL